MCSNYRNRVAHCDVGGAFSDPTSDIQSSFEIKSWEYEPQKYIPKEYRIELKPLLSAFEPRTFALTSLRSFLLYYLPLLEPHPNAEDDDDFLQDAAEERHVDLAVPFKKSVKQIVREVSVTNISEGGITVFTDFTSAMFAQAWKLREYHVSCS